MLKDGNNNTRKKLRERRSPASSLFPLASKDKEFFKMFVDPDGNPECHPITSIMLFIVTLLTFPINFIKILL